MIYRINNTITEISLFLPLDLTFVNNFGTLSLPNTYKNSVCIPYTLCVYLLYICSGKTKHSFSMNKKLLENLKAKCKDMGLSDAALEQIAGIASNGLDEAATDEAIEERAKQYVPVLQAMQSEATRWAQKNRQEPPTPPTPPTPPPTKPNEAEPWRAAIEEAQKQYTEAMQKQGETIAKLQAQLAQSERTGVIAAACKKLGLTDADMEFVSIPADANIDEYLGKYKQSLVNRGLKPADPHATKEAKAKAESEMAEAMLKQFSVGNE